MIKAVIVPTTIAGVPEAENVHANLGRLAREIVFPFPDLCEFSASILRNSCRYTSRRGALPAKSTVASSSPAIYDKSDFRVTPDRVIGCK